MIEYIGWGFAGLVLIGQVIYIRATNRNEAAPSGVTWLIWAFVNGTMSYLQNRAGNQATAYVLWAYSFGSFLSFLFAQYRGHFEFSIFQKLCFALSMLALLDSFRASMVEAITLNVAAHFIGSLPLLALALSGKSKEPMASWWIWWVAALGNLLIALNQGALLIAPVYYFVSGCLVNTLLVSAARRRGGRRLSAAGERLH